MGDLLLGIDIGTSACKAALFGTDGTLIASCDRPYPVRYPAPGFAEQDPDEWWAQAASAVRELLAQSGVRRGDIAGVGVDGQSWSAVHVDAAGNVLAPTAIWTDTRARAECDDMRRAVPEAELFACSGNPVTPSYTLPKVLWMRKHAPDISKKTAAVLQSNGFLVYRLTGALTQDVSQGYGWNCFDMRRGGWNEDIARRLGIDPKILPPVTACHAVVGRVTDGAAALTGLLAGTPVVAGGLDAACGTLGAGVIDQGQTQEQGGQAGGMSICMDACRADPALILGMHAVPKRWLLQGGTTGGGGALKWFRSVCCPERSFADMSALAGEAAPGCGGVLFLPYMAGERSPLWEPDAKGVFFGIDASKTRGEMIRAVMEGVAFALRHNLDTAEAAGASADVLRSVGGSAASAVWTQLKADVTGHPVETPDAATATVHGAAILAGVGTGAIPDFAAAARTVRVLRRYEPDPERHALYNEAYGRWRALSADLLPLMRRFADRA